MMTKCEMSGEPYSQKSGWVNYSNEQIFQIMTFRSLYSNITTYNITICCPLLTNGEKDFQCAKG